MNGLAIMPNLFIIFLEYIINVYLVSPPKTNVSIYILSAGQIYKFFYSLSISLKFAHIAPNNSISTVNLAFSKVRILLVGFQHLIHEALLLTGWPMEPSTPHPDNKSGEEYW
jgi:hypothetical protein